jgi:apolipoprotein N-acyltransferase
LPRLVIWPESPLNLTYSRDPVVRARITEFTIKNHASLVFNSIEPAATNGTYNSALMVNEQGHLVAQHNKIRMMPFGEYLPLPHWLARASRLHALVANFLPGTTHPLMPFGDLRAGVFICIESEYPPIHNARWREKAPTC